MSRRRTRIAKLHSEHHAVSRSRISQARCDNRAVDALTLDRYEAQGNDFLIALLTERKLLDLDASLAARDLARHDVARAVCDRLLGVGTRPGYVHSRGADGFIVGVHDAVDGRPADRIRMHLLNADGSFAETSGNGLACLAMASFDARIIGAGPLIPFETDAGEQRCTVHHDGSARLAGPRTPIAGDDSAERRSVEVAMNPIRQGPAIPKELEERIRGTFGSDLRHLRTGDVGNPHLVIALARPPIEGPSSELGDRADELGASVAKLGRIYETYFADGINVEFIWPLPSSVPSNGGLPRTLVMSVWERGAGLTVSCGSGSIVAATLARKWGFVRDLDQVDMQTAPFPGGNGSDFRYWVRTVPASLEAFDRPQLCVEAERIEAGIDVCLDDIGALLADHADHFS